MTVLISMPRLPQVGPRALLTAISIAIVLWLFSLSLERTSPGPLSEPHARETALVEKGSCDACHGGWGQSMASACGECHQRVDTEVEDGHGFHGALADVEKCEVCHREHRGADFQMVSDLGFRQAGFASREDYDHAGLGFALAGRHAELECTACHESADVDVIAKGAARFVGLEQRCDSCHDDPHEGRMRRDCADCHGQDEPFSAVATFVHSDVFPLVGAHAEPSCRECHSETGPDSVEALSGPRPPASVRTCAQCHESPHRGEFLAESAVLAAAPPGESCVVCHGGVEGSFAGSEALMPRELHAAAGFALDGAHASVECAECHGEPGSSWGREGSALAGVAALAGLAPREGGAAFAERFPGRSPESCSTCHEDPHGGQFAAADSAFAGRECSACHAGEGFVPPSFGLADHARTGFPLDGGHAAVGCRDCHLAPGSGADVIPDAASPRVFHGTPQACEACHEDAHSGRFDDELAARAGGADTEGCALCHVTTTFADVSLAAASASADRRAGGKPLAARASGAAPAGFDHALWTGFALAGAHARADCASCHPSTPRADALGRRFGRVDEVFGRPVEACSTCHADVHDGAFDEPPSGQGAAAATSASDCSRCHDVESFSVVAAADFDHGRWTGFALDGAHLEADCESCHVRAARPDARGRSFGSVAATFGTPADRCDTCHADVHFGAFDKPGLPAAVAGREGCARCHATAAFLPTAKPFDHGSWTGYPLLAAHAPLDCAQCHASAPIQGDAGANVPSAGRVLGRVAGTTCQSCHASPHVGQFAVQGRTDCERCHVAEGTFADLVFDHDLHSRFPLDATHRVLECAACHRPWPLPGGGEAVRYKPLGTTCSDCHGIDVGPR